MEALLPDLRLFWVDAEGADVFVTQHLATMRSSNPGIIAKEFNGLGYGAKAETTAWGLLSERIDVQLGETQPR